MAAKGKTPKKFRQARSAAKKDSKKVFNGPKKAGLKDKSPFTKYSADDVEVLKEMKKEAKGNYITDDKGNKISVKPTETSAERMARDRAAAKAEALKMYPYDKAELEAMSKSERAAAELAQKRTSNPNSAKTGKPTPKLSEMQKVRSAVTATEPKPQSFKVDKDGKKIRPKGFVEIQGKKYAIGGPAEKKMSELRKIQTPSTKAPVVKKGFAAGKELNAEGKAIYDKLIKEGVKPKSALNKALFRQEKGAKVAAKAAAPIAKAAKSAAAALEVPAKDSMLRQSLKISTKTWANMTPTQKLNAMKKDNISKIPSRMPKIQKEIKAKYAANKVTAKPEVKKVVAKAVTKPSVKNASVASKVGKAAFQAAKTTAMIAGPGKLLKAGAVIKGAVVGTKAVKVAKATKAAESGTKISAANNARKAANVAKKEKLAGMSKGKKALRATAIGAGLYGIGMLPLGGGKDKRTLSAGGPVVSRPTRPEGAYPKGGGKGLSGPKLVTGVGAGGSTYKVNAGDTLSGIAKKAGVTLSELMAENKKITDPRKIYRNTSVKIPAKGKMPTGGYAGPIPYRPKKK